MSSESSTPLIRSSGVQTNKDDHGHEDGSTVNDYLSIAPILTSPSPPIPPSPVKVPIPWTQLLPLIILRILDSLNYCIIFPYIVAYINTLPDVPPNKIGLYAGMAEGSIMVIEAVVAPFWSILSDRYGRKRCLIVGFSVGSLVDCFLEIFGLNPGPTISRTMFTELSHPTNRSVIFSIWGPLFSVGACFGTLLGGLLAEPYGKLPRWLGGNWEFWKDWPFALPGIVCFGLSVLAIIYCQVMVEETRPKSLLREREQDSHEVESLITSTNNNDNDGQNRRLRNKFSKTLNIPGFKLVLICFCAFQISTFAYDGFYSVFTYTPIPKGGLGLPIATIGIIASLSAIANIILTPLCVPPLQAKLGIKIFLLIAVGTISIESLLVPAFQNLSHLGKGAIYTVLVVQQLLKNFHLMAWPLNDQLTAACFDDHPDLLATGSAIVLMAGAGGRAIGPIFAGWGFSISAEYPSRTFRRQISWLVLLLISFLPLIATFYLPRDGPKSQKDDRVEYQRLSNENEHLDDI